MISRASRALTRPARIIRRYISSSRPSRQAQSGHNSSQKHKAPSLPSEKLRALVSLYHQSEQFITPENLSERIDFAFARDDTFHTRRFIKPADLSKMLKDRREAPRMVASHSNHSSSRLQREDFSDFQKRPREVRMKEALYGVDFGNQKTFMPGLEMMQDMVHDGLLPED